MKKQTLHAVGHFGTTLRATRIGAFALTEAQYRPGLRTGWHLHGSPAFCVVLSGRYVERFRGTVLECPTGTVVFRPAGIEHFDEVGVRGATCFFVEPAPGWQPTPCERALVTGGAQTIVGGRAHWLIEQARQEMRHPDTITPLALDGIIHMLVAECARSNRAKSPASAPWLRRAHDLLSERFADAPTLAELSTESGVHPTYLATAFRRAFGTTVGEYVRSLRVQAAQRMLRDSDRSLAQIALETGFADQSHFTRVFRRATGLTPKVYRELKVVPE